MATVADYMTKDPIVLKLEHPIYHAFSMMELHRLRHLPIVNEEGELTGIVSDRDLKRHMSSSFDEEERAFVDGAMLGQLSDIMTSEPVTFHPDELLITVAQEMLSRKISSVVIVDKGEKIPVGILTDTDMLRVLVELLAEKQSD